MSTFYVTAVRYSADGSHITHVMAHTSANVSGRLLKGIIWSRSDVVKSINENNTFITGTYSYNDGKWHVGSNISIVHIGNIDYLRTFADKTAKDNLGSLLLIDELR